MVIRMNRRCFLSFLSAAPVGLPLALTFAPKTLTVPAALRRQVAAFDNERPIICRGGETGFTRAQLRSISGPISIHISDTRHLETRTFRKDEIFPISVPYNRSAA